jgi:hypothetical protein
MLPEPTVLLNEKGALRDELKHLKLCQLNYFTISVTATGALLGIGSKIGNVSALLYLSPLLIILPCWWIFFDKATTIARIVGYLTVIDWILSSPGDTSRYRYIGWETALHHYRSTSKENSLPDWFERFGQGLKFGLWVLAFQTSHRYWSINYYTYASLSFICWGLGSGIFLGTSGYAVSLPVSLGLLLIIVLSLIYNLYLAGDLIKGRRSYEAHTRAWARMLRKENAEELLRKSLEGEAQDSPNPGPQPDRNRASHGPAG